jgi:tetratricopeptide (TPR) repeat protein
MRIDGKLALTLGAAALTSACAAGAAGGGGGPRVSVPAPDVACSTGELRAFAVADSAAATLALLATVAESEHPARFALALEQARRATAAQPQNAYGYYLAAQASLGTEDFAAAERYMGQAVERCPEVAAELSDYRAVAASQAFERGSALLASGDTTAGLAAYEASLRLYPDNYPADFYIGLIAFQRQNTAQAVERWRRMLGTLDRLTPSDDADVERDRASARANVMNALIFASRQYLERDDASSSASLLEQLRRDMPGNAEAAYFHALALNTQQRWGDLLPVARQATELAPLSYGAWILYYNAYAGQSQAATQARNTAQAAELARQARGVSERSEALPMQVEGVTVDVAEAETRIRGVAVGTGRTAPVTLEFVLHGLGGEVGRGRVTVTPPAREQQQPFELTVPDTGPVTGVSYRVVGG